MKSATTQYVIVYQKCINNSWGEGIKYFPYDLTFLWNGTYLQVYTCLVILFIYLSYAIKDLGFSFWISNHTSTICIIEEWQYWV